VPRHVVDLGISIDFPAIRGLSWDRAYRLLIQGGVRRQQ